MSQATSYAMENQTGSAADRLRGQFVAMKLSFRWFGVHKTLSDQQKQRAAASFNAEEGYLSAGKKLIDTSHPKFRSVNQIRTQAIQYWKCRSLPYPEPGLRLIRNCDIDDLNLQMSDFRGELQAAVQALERDFGLIKTSARLRLGSLYVEEDYPERLADLFDIAWEFPSVDPPLYLMRLSPEVYESQCQQVQARFDEAVRLAEQAYFEELSRLVTHLGERLSGNDDGKSKVFRDSAITNLNEFFSRFRTLNIHSSEQLDHLVDQANDIIQNVAPQDLRDNSQLRQSVASQLSVVQSTLDGLMVDRPRRRIIRSSVNSEGN